MAGSQKSVASQVLGNSFAVVWHLPSATTATYVLNKAYGTNGTDPFIAIVISRSSRLCQDANIGTLAHERSPRRLGKLEVERTAATYSSA
jgi:hypothetical protein